MTITIRSALLLAGLGLALPATAQDVPQEAPSASDSGIVVAPRQERIPLDAFMAPLGCPEDLPDGEICITADPFEEDTDPGAPEPGDRRLDAAAERRALSNVGADRLPTNCGAPIGPATTGCAIEQLESHREQKELLDERYLPPEPE